jgi:dihydrofolate reductase
MKGAKVVAIAAIGRNRELGRGNELLWRIPEDLHRFKELTTGHPIILGRKTFESIVGYLGKPLPGRQNIVVTRDPSAMRENVSPSWGNVEFVASVEEAIEKGKALDDNQISIGGGAQIYEAALPFTDILHLTIIDDRKEADSFFPAYEQDFTRVLSDEHREFEGLAYRWVDLSR